MGTDTPIMVRARITSDEWTRLRTLSLKVGESAADIIGGLIRDYVDLHDPPPVSGKGKGNRAT